MRPARCAPNRARTELGAGKKASTVAADLTTRVCVSVCASVFCVLRSTIHASRSKLASIWQDTVLGHPSGCES